MHIYAYIVYIDVYEVLSKSVCSYETMCYCEIVGRRFMKR